MKNDIKINQVIKLFHDTPMVYLRLKRESLGMTQREFAMLFNMSWDTYRKYEDGTRRPSRNAFAMMKLIVECYEKEYTDEN